MIEPFDFFWYNLGTAGIGLVWGWWCMMRFKLARPNLLTWWSVLFFTAMMAALISWPVLRFFPGMFFLLCTGGSAFVHYLWLQYLRKHYS